MDVEHLRKNLNGRLREPGEWTPLWPTLEADVAERQPKGKLPKPNGDGWIGPICSPLREDRNPSFSILPDSPNDPGAWVDHGTGERGSIADLAELLGVDPRQTETGAPISTGPEITLEEFCRRRKLTKDELKRWQVREVTYRDRPALRYSTDVGVDRVKFIDGAPKPLSKYEWAGTGGHRYWYGSTRAKEIGGEVLYLVNGEPSIWSCSQAGVAAVCTLAGEETGPTDEMVEQLKAAPFSEFKIVYDRDQAGRDGAKKVMEKLTEAGLDAAALELPAHLGNGGDLDDLHRLVGDGDLGKHLAELPELAGEPDLQISVEPWPDLQPLPPETDPVPDLPPEMLPQALRPWIEDIAQRAAIPLEFPAVSALVSLATVVGRQIAIRPERRDNWTVVPNLWGGIVARPGMIKTYALDCGVDAIVPLIKEAAEENEQEKIRVRAEKMVLEDRLKAARRTKAGASVDTVAQLLTEIEACRVVQRRYKTNDPSVEKLGELLRDNPRGLLLYRDELAGWLRSLQKPGREGEREFYLEAWNGAGAFTVDRIERGTIEIPAMCVSVLGGIQPGKLNAYIHEAITEGHGADGLLQRLQVVVWPDGMAPWKRTDHWPDREAEEIAFSVYRALDKIDPVALGADTTGPIPYLRFDGEAQILFNQWRDGLENRLRSDEFNSTPAFEGHVAKYRSLMPSLALLFHLVDVVVSTDDIVGGVTVTSAALAADWCDYLEHHAKKVYSAELKPERSGAHALAERIRDGEIDDRTTVRDLYRNRWAGLATLDQAMAALKVLQGQGWVQLETGNKTGPGRRPLLIRMHPDLLEGGADE